METQTKKTELSNNNKFYIMSMSNDDCYINGGYILSFLIL